MTPKQILDSFSETLMRDERILSTRERALLSNLLQHAKSASEGDDHTHEAVRAVIASAVGETVAQRAFSVLGASIVGRILENGTSVQAEFEYSGATEILAAPRGPQTPSGPKPKKEPRHHERDTPTNPPGPQSPGTSAPKIPPAGPQSPGTPLRTPAVPGPQSPGTPLRTPAVPAGPQSPGTPLKSPKVPAGPQSPGTPLRTPLVPAGPQSPGSSVERKVVTATAAAVVERPETLPARCVILDEFLAPQEVAELTRFALEREADFQASEVVSPVAEGGIVNYDHRRSRVLMDLGQHEEIILQRIKAVLPEVVAKLGMEEFDISSVEAQITASNDGDFFHFHSDNGSDRVATRHLTFVYFFHQEPRQFEGGELRLHDSRLDGDQYVSDGTYQSISPQQNQIVFFPCELMHEITPVKCESQLFADSRFTLNGWLRR
ncbi:MAG TPA: 2OG-Fe(II) oxygenase [Candidatus Sulfotelmatobacter sp.]|nr:2OG-Fe(II) oxygenase [Candidatus Sulfotelmatobacter sp.]